MHQAPRIEPGDVVAWAMAVDVELVTSLLRRLLWAHAEVHRLEPQADGQWGHLFVEATKGEPYCPEGRSAWFIRGWAPGSTAASPPPPAPSRQSDVIVVPWGTSDLPATKWGARVLGADQLADWMNECPAVSAWFAKFFGKLRSPTNPVLDVETYLEIWSVQTSPPLPAALVLEGRLDAIDRVRAWVDRSTRRRSNTLRIHADSIEEARVFAAAALSQLPPDMREPTLARAVVVSSREAWSELIQHPRPLILIPNFEDFSPDLVLGQHLVLEPASARSQNDDPFQGGSRVELADPIPWPKIAHQLSTLGLSESRALRVAKESLGHLEPLRHLLGVSKAPGWTAHGERRDLAVLLLLGAWDPQCDADADAVAKLGSERHRLEALCHSLSIGPDSPIEDRGTGWGWRRPVDPWASLIALLDDEIIRGFGELAAAVLAEENTRLQLAAGGRVVASRSEAEPRFSHLLRQGVAESLVRLVMAADNEHLDRVLIERVTHDVLGTVLAPSWRRWASLDWLLTILAEADPDLFLAKLESSIHAEDGVLHLVDQADPEWLRGDEPLHGSSLSALELLAWIPTMLERSTRVMAMLAEHDPTRSEPNRRWSNHPHRSLEGVFHLIAPQTASDEDARFLVLEHIVESHGEVGWSLLIELVDQLDGGELPTHGRPRLRFEAPPDPESFPDALIRDRFRRIEGLLLQAADLDLRRWATLLKKGLDHRISADLLDAHIASLIDRKPENGSDELWAAVRVRLSRYHVLERDQPEQLGRLERLYAAFEPDELARKFTWLFQSGMLLPEPHSDDFGQIEAKLRDRRIAALETILERPDGLDILTSISQRVGDLRTFGSSLARCPQAKMFEDLLLTQNAHAGLASVAPYLAIGVFHREQQNWSWLARLLADWRAQSRNEQALELVLGLWSEPPLWNLLDEVGDPLRREYWTHCGLVGKHQPPEWERAVNNLLAAGNVGTALAAVAAAETLHLAEFRPGTLVALLEQVKAGFSSNLDSESYYQILDVFRALDRHVEKESEDCPSLQTLAQLELDFDKSLRFSRRPPRHVPKVLENPDEFVKLVKLVYGEHRDDDATATAARKKRARLALSVFHTGNGYPGHETHEPSRWEPILRDWSRRVLAGLAETGLDEWGQREVATVLARPEHAEDGHWPCLAARECVESGYAEFVDALHGAKREQIGLRGFVKTSDEGGTQERALAEQFAHSATALRPHWPRTAELLDTLAHGYEQDAQREDEGPDRMDLASPEPGSVTQLEALQQLELVAIGPAARLSVEFVPRINVLVGDNGLGKTFILEIAWWVLTGSWTDPERPAWPDRAKYTEEPQIRISTAEARVVTSQFDSQREDWPRVPEWPRPTGPVIYARIDGGVSVWDPLRNDLYGLGDRRSMEAYHFGAAELEHGLLDRRGSHKHRCNGLIKDWEHWRHNDAPLFESFFDVVRQLFAPDGAERDMPTPGPAIQLWPKGSDETPIPTLEFSYGRVPLVHLSSGMRRVLGLAYALVWTWNGHRRAAEGEGRPPARHMIFMLDEAELHLHPKWQRLLLPALLRAIGSLAGVEVQLIVTTHSPLVLASLETLFDEPRDRLFHLDIVESKVQVDELLWANHGEIGYWLTSEVFDLAQPLSLEAELAIEAARLFIRGEQPPDPQLRTQAQIEGALRRSVVPDHEIWRRWERIYGGAAE